MTDKISRFEFLVEGWLEHYADLDAPAPAIGLTQVHRTGTVRMHWRAPTAERS